MCRFEYHKVKTLGRLVMEISNKIPNQNFSISKCAQKQLKPSCKASFRGNFASGTCDFGALGKTKVALDDKKILTLDEKLELLKSAGVDECNVKNYLEFTDEDFKNALLYIKKGVPPQDAYDFMKNFANKSVEPVVLELIENGVPYSLAEHIRLSRSLYDEKYFDNDKIETIKNGNFNSSKYKDDFKAEDYYLTSIFGNAMSTCDSEKYKMFCELQKRGIDGNIAVHIAEKGSYYPDKIRSILDNKEIEFSSNTKCAYYLKNITENEMQKISEICKKFNLDPNNYNDWAVIIKTKEPEEIEQLLSKGAPIDILKIKWKIDDEKLKKTIDYMQKGNISATNAFTLTDFKDDVAAEIIEYLNYGLDINNAMVLTRIGEDKEKKKEIANLVLDGSFSHVMDVKEFLGLDLDSRAKEKVLELIRLGACLPLAILCTKDEKCHNEALDLINSGTCKDLKDIYAYDADNFLSNAELLKLGIPKEYLSMYSCTLTNEQKELMKLGVPFEAIKEAQDNKLELIMTDEIKELLKKGVDYETACRLNEIIKNDSGISEFIIEMAEPDLIIGTICELAQIQQTENSFKKEDLEIVKGFARKFEDCKNFKELYELGLFNKQALDNFEEFTKRGIKTAKNMDALAVAQIDFKDSKEIDRACELLKNNVASQKIPFLIKDDGSTLRAINDKDCSSHLYGENEILAAYMAKYIKDGMPQKDVELIGKKIFHRNKINLLDNFLKKGHSAKEAVEIANANVFLSSPFSETTSLEEKQKKDTVSHYVLQGCSVKGLLDIVSNDKKLQKLESIIDKGIEPIIAEKLVLCNIDINNKKEIEKIKALCNPNLKNEFAKMNSNPLLTPMVEQLYDFKNYDSYNFKKLVESGLTIEDIKKSALMFIKSPLKQAMKHPNLYLSNLPSIDTEKISGKYPELTGEKLERYQNKMLDFFKDNMSEITRTLKYLDIDTFNQMMDKRTTFFGEQLKTLNKMDNKHFEITSAITKCQKNDGKLLSAKEKIDLSKIVLYHQLGYIDTDYLENSIKENKVNVEDLNKKIFEKLIEIIGINPDEIKNIPEEKLDFDKEYMYLLLRTQESTDFLLFKEMMGKDGNIEEARKEIEEMLELSDEEIIHNGSTRESCEELLKLIDKMDTMDEKEIFKEFSRISPFSHVDCTIQEVAKIALLEDFKTYITKGDNKFAKANKETENKFKELGLNYEKWLNYDEKTDIELNDRKYQIKLWDRKPQKDLFMGNRTSCCTAVIDGGNGKATPIYLTNTAFNVVQLKDKNGNIVGMSRIFVGNIDEKPATIIENIEINSAFSKTLTDEEIKNLRDNMFNYIKNFTKEISGGQDMKVYFSKSYTHVPTDDLNSAQENVDFVGNLTSDSIYLNCAPGWVQPETLKNKICDLYEI